MIERPNNNSEKLPTFSLRQATRDDLPFLFKVSTDAMRPVTAALNPGREFNEEEEFAKYEEKFEPEKIKVIQYEGHDVGRLRVVRTPESIYIGGLQILPEFQGMGIGSAINQELIDESNRTGIPIISEVHHVNEKNLHIKEKFGFKEISRNETQVVMKYTPKRT
ncbi:GNAT family N-acetyltransferase [Patescibacteria group bacterium]|nr:GNAT family N-acetyltransferase [Patescibacteria group bacterium]MBU1755166.1 GNAT family N-acetyltransferase [Patescibacteria group bacterium]